MYNHKKIAVIIAAAGLGTRMDCNMPKQFLNLGGQSILTHTVNAFEKNEFIDEIVIVTNENYIDYCHKELIEQCHFYKIKNIIPGGAERQDSIYNALKSINETVDYVLVHDGARPFVTQEIIGDVIVTMIEKGAAVAAVPVKDTIKEAEEGVFSITLQRSRLFSVQTPQGFSKELLLSAYEEAYKRNFYGTDDAVLVEKLGQKVYLVKGNYNNIKITTKEDLIMGEAILYSNQKLPRVGTGFDVHELVENRELVLGGVTIPYEKGLLGHSDADVLVHAIMDAILGAAALGDIGKHFPDTDAAYQGISSLALLEKVGRLISEKGFIISNIDATVIAERPKIAPYIPEMRANIAKALAINLEQINIKGTTTEKLGFCGRQEGIAAQGSVLII